MERNDQWEERLDDFQARVDKRVERVKKLREQGLLEQAAREDQVHQSELEELARITGAIQRDPACQPNPSFPHPDAAPDPNVPADYVGREWEYFGCTRSEWQEHVEKLRRQGCL